MLKNWYQLKIYQDKPKIYLKLIKKCEIEN